MSLLQKCIEQDSTSCLYITCEYLLNGNISSLEDEWINISSQIGFNKKLVFGKLWCEVNEELVSLLKKENLNVKDALIMTSKLYILNSRLSDSFVATNENIKKIRNEIIEFFPESAALSYEGIKMYRRLLPSQTADNYIFYSRILASFSKLFESYIDKGEESKQDDIRNALEYISRKRNEMNLPSQWPLPSMQKNMGFGDPVWFLWGMMLCYFSDKKVATNFELFSWNYKKSLKLNRIGLLWGLAYCFKNNLAYSWTSEETKVLQKVDEIAADLWKDVREKHKEAADAAEAADEESESDDFHFNLHSYIPRSYNFINEMNSSSSNDATGGNTQNKKAVIIKQK